MTYTNIHGQPLRVSAEDAVLACEPKAYASYEPLEYHDHKEPRWVIRIQDWRAFAYQHQQIGAGATEESAWREAWSRMLADEVAKGSKA